MRGGPPGVLEQQQRQQAERLGLVGHQLGQQCAARRIASSHRPRADQVGAGGGDVPLVEQQVDARPSTAARPLGQQVGGRHPVGDAGVAGSCCLARTSRLAIVGLGHQEGPGDLGRGQPGERAQRQRHPRLERQRRVAAGEDQPQPVVGDAAAVAVVVDQRRARRSSAGRHLLAASRAPDRARGAAGRWRGCGPSWSARRRVGRGRRRAATLAGRAAKASWAHSSARSQSPVTPDQRGDDAAPLVAGTPRRPPASTSSASPVTPPRRAGSRPVPMRGGRVARRRSRWPRRGRRTRRWRTRRSAPWSRRTARR